VVEDKEALGDWEMLGVWEIAGLGTLPNPTKLAAIAKQTKRGFWIRFIVLIELNSMNRKS
jgi:hypothetical protein